MSLQDGAARRSIAAWNERQHTPLFGDGHGAPAPVDSMTVQRHAGGPDDGWQQRTFDNHVLTLFVHGGVVEHALDGCAPRRIVIPRSGVVSSLRGVCESVRLVHETDIFAVQLSNAALEDIVNSVDSSLLPASPGILDPRLTGLMVALRAEQDAGWPAGPLFADSIMHALALLSAGITSPPAIKGFPAWLTARIVDKIDARLAEPLRLAELADEACYSVAQFTRLFRATFGMSPLRYVFARRIDRACHMLRQSRLGQIDIALACGFQSQQHFSRVFRAHAGVTPSTYRQRR